MIFLIAAAALSYAYNRVGWHYSDITAKKMVLYIAIGIVSTLLIFWSVSGMLLRVMMSMKSVYYRGLNSFTFRQISSKVNTMVFSMSVICLMLFVTICALSASFSMRNSMNANLQELCPADIELSVNLYEPLEGLDLVSECKENGLDIMAYTGESVRFYSYGDENFTFSDFCGEEIEKVQEQFQFLDYSRNEKLVGINDYNALMKLYGKETLSLNDDEYFLLCDYKSMKAIRDSVIKKGGDITVYGKTLHSKYDECQDGFIDISAQHINIGIFVVPDSVLRGRYRAETTSSAITRQKIKQAKRKRKRL